MDGIVLAFSGSHRGTHVGSIDLDIPDVRSSLGKVRTGPVYIQKLKSHPPQVYLEHVLTSPLLGISREVHHRPSIVLELF